MPNAAKWSLARTHSDWEIEHGEPIPSVAPSAPLEQVPRPLRAELGKALESAIRGEVRFDDGSRALYATDGSNYRQIPIGVVVPRSEEDVLETLRVCRQFGAPVLSRGGGTSLAGQCCNVAVVMDFSKYLNAIQDVDPRAKTARVQPGVVLDQLRNRTKREHGLTFGPDPATHSHCTFGGMIGNNSCGVHALMSGRTSDNVHELDIVTYDGLRMRVGATSDGELAAIIAQGGRRGEIYARLKGLRDRYAPLIRERYPKIPRRVSGYNLDDLLPEHGFNVARALVGTEGTCVTVLEATLRLIDWPPYQSLLILGYPDVFSAGDHVPFLRQFGPIGLEGIDDKLVDYSVKKGLHPDARDRLPPGKGWLLVEFGGQTKQEADARLLLAKAALDALPGAPHTKWLDDPAQEERIWKIRESGLGATSRIPGREGHDIDTWPGWEDSAVAPEKVGDYLRELRALFDKFDYETALYGHFGQGCIHVRTPFDLMTREGIRKYRNFMDEATDLVLRFGGSLSGEHGDGQARAEFLPKMFGPELVEAFREFKSIWDPEGRMNPGKVVDPYPIDTNLRLGTDYRPPQHKTHFKFPDDQGSVDYATLRCVGVGKCRRSEEGTMCPSYMVTREEMHSTRGRSRLLHEALTGDFLKGDWSSEPVKEALDLCLACKGCRKECPVNVDMATYKAEFLSHYYERKARPRTAYAFGYIDQWSRLGSLVPELANFFTQTPGLSWVAKELAGVAHERKIPPFATRTFKSWFFARPRQNAGMPRVLLWPDTFTNYFEPAIARASVEVLEAAGFEVIVPRQHLCCGRPLYDYGFLKEAKSYLRKAMQALRPVFDQGIPIVGLEPSCLAVFKDELRNLFPMDRDAQRLQESSYPLADFLEERASGFEIPRLSARAVVQGHCHHKNVMSLDAEKRLLARIGVDAEVPDSGCCGLAGSFGFEAANHHYDVSMAIGERVILPKVRQAEREALIIADGFSCRHQISQGTDRKALHLAQVIQRALSQQ